MTGYGAARASWWPAWVAAFAVALISYTQGRDVAIVPEIIDRVHVFTTTKLRGIYSVVTHRVQQSIQVSPGASVVMGPPNHATSNGFHDVIPSPHHPLEEP